MSLARTAVRTLARSAVASFVAILLAVALSPQTKASRPSPMVQPISRAESGSATMPATVTLVTGDKVTLTPAADGPPTVLFEPADPGDSGRFSTLRDHGRISVIPASVATLVPDLLDPALFDVTGLVEMGYDDRSRDDLPVIVERATGTKAPASVDKLLVTERQLLSIHATAAVVVKSQARALGRQLATLNDPSHPELAATALSGITRIWLDGVVEATTVDGPLEASTLEGYLDQIKAPAAWASGLDGTGVRVAVLDTGVDHQHPDLVGQVDAEANFTEEPSPDDENGHGTHVASILAGAGVGSHGTLQGIAPRADLLSGKVLDHRGGGQFSWVIEGMQWAVDQGADVVNLSLGARAGDLDDPVAQAVDALSATSGALFVIAAGNQGGLGWSPYSINTPGIAASALTVGAVTDTDALAGFSSEGPTRGSERLKPEIAAPGVDIRGAKAGARETDLYTQMTGTSQATPIVAGAAVLLRQLHPDWTWQRVKSQLVTTADPAEYQTAWSHGSGRLDLDQATSQLLTPDVATLGFGLVKYPDEAAQERSVTLTNDDTDPVTVVFSDEESNPDGTAASADAVTVQPATVTVPAGGEATVTVRFDAGLVEDGYWQGAVTAAAGDVEMLRLPFTAFDEPERYDLSVKVLDRNGEPAAGAQVLLFNGETGYRTARVNDSGDVTARLQPGPWSVHSIVPTPARGNTPETWTIAVSPEISLDQDTSYLLDTRTAEQLRAPEIAGTPTKLTEASLIYDQENTHGSSYRETLLGITEDVLAGRIFVTPTEPLRHGSFEAVLRWRLEPVAAPRHGAPEAYELLSSEHRFTSPLAPDLTKDDVRKMATVTDVIPSLSHAGRAAVSRGFSTTGLGDIKFYQERVVTTPATRVHKVSAGADFSWYQCLWIPEPPEQSHTRLCNAETRSYAEGEHAVETWAAGLHPEIRSGAQTADAVSFLAGIGDGPHVGPLGYVATSERNLTLFRNGELVGSADDVAGYFPVPAERARYRLEQSWTLLPGALPVAREATSVWEFTSAAPADPAQGGQTTPSLISLDYGVDVDSHGRVRARRPLTFNLAIAHLAGSTAKDRAQDADLSYSLDGGAHWSSLRTRRTAPDGFTASIPGSRLHPGARVSVRVRASDTDGGRLDQTVIGMFLVA